MNKVTKFHSWSVLQAKRKKSKMERHLLAFLTTPSDNYQVTITIYPDLLYIKAVGENVDHPTIVLDGYRMAGFEDTGTIITIHRRHNRPSLALHFANEYIMETVLKALRRIGSDESSDSGQSNSGMSSTTPSPPPEENV